MWLVRCFDPEQFTVLIIIIIIIMGLESVSASEDVIGDLSVKTVKA